MQAWGNGVRKVGPGDWSSQPTNPDWSEDQTTAKWTPKHVHALRWPKRRPAPTPTPHGGIEISRAVAPAQSDQADALKLKTRLIWTYSATAAVAVFLALMSSHALLGLFGQADLPHASAAAAPATRVAPAAKADKKPEPAARLLSVASPQPTAAARRLRVARSHAHARASVAPQARVENDAADPNLEPDMTFMDAPISAREARAIAEGRARLAGTPARASEEPAVSQPGTLRINSRPWAQLYIDGQLVGNTPQLGLRVSPGEHSIRLVNPQFVMSKSFSVNVGAGETVTRVESLED
jgi:hypothetical protein